MRHHDSNAAVFIAETTDSVYGAVRVGRIGLSNVSIIINVMKCHQRLCHRLVSRVEETRSSFPVRRSDR